MTEIDVDITCLGPAQPELMKYHNLLSDLGYKVITSKYYHDKSWVAAASKYGREPS